MPPKKREKDADGNKAEQELFLQAFEKPTQIYRYLRERNTTNPVLLSRNLSYMKDRMSRNHKRRKGFKLDNLLQLKLNKILMDKANIFGNFLNIVYIGVFDQAKALGWTDGDAVTVEAILCKISHSKRKDSSSDFQQSLISSSRVVINPSEEIDKYSSISIPIQSFRPYGETLNKTYKILFRIEVASDECNYIEDEQNDEIAAKRPKTSSKVYGSELTLFDKNNRCVFEGDYEAALQDITSNAKNFSPKKKWSWESLPDNYIAMSDKFEIFNKRPTLKFRLKWSDAENPSVIDSSDLPPPEVINLDEMKDDQSLTNYNNNSIETIQNGYTNGKSKKDVESKIQIVYNFIYSNNTRQQTEYTNDLICPWCELYCVKLYSLLKHLKLCHARLNFTYNPETNGARIDVTVNDAYDGSYAGSPFDLVGPSGCSFARTYGPVRRTPVTNLLVCRPRRKENCLTEFLELDEDELNNQRPYITGHNRLYHHTETCLPVHPKGLDMDSEGENDPLWLRQKTIQMIDEFSDVNEGEKELMKMWNLHVMKNGYVGDCQLPIACDMFIVLNGQEIIEKNLYRNFILHMCSLFDFGLVSPEVVYNTIQKLKGILSQYPDGRKIISNMREAQLDYWLKVGIHKQEERDKLKSPVKPTSTASKPRTIGTPYTATSSPSKSLAAAGSAASSSKKKPQTTAVKSPTAGTKLPVVILNNVMGATRKGNIVSKSLNKNGDGASSVKQIIGGKRSLNGSRSSSSTTTTSSTLHHATDKCPSKRRLSQLRDPSPPRRRSAPQTTTRPMGITTRRQSIAVVNHSDFLTPGHTTLRKRQQTKDKH